MKHYISAILNILLISSLCGCATEDYVSIVGQIEGTVIDGVSKKVIESCEVISPHNGTSLTDSHGHFSFQEVIPGTIQLTYKRLGYETTMCEVVVHAGKTTPANISLNPEKADCKLSPNTTILDLGNRNGVVELILKNTSNQLITYSIQCDATEISFDPPRGTIVGQNSSIIKVAVDRTELSEGHYERTASIITADSSIDIQIVFDKGLETRPTVSTISLEQDDMEPTTLVANGAIMSVGSSNIIQHGFCYSTQPEPSLVENEGIIKLGSLSTPANFTYNLARLDFEKQYYVRAYATNRQGTSYGEVISKFMERLDIISIITQDATSVTSSSAMLNVKVAGGNISDFIEVGFYYGTTEKCETKIVADSSNGQATNSAGIVINGLKSDTKYFFKGYGITKSGEKEGEIKSFQTAKSSSANTEINCETESASNITVNSAVIHGKFTVSGTLKIKEWGFYYGSNPTPSVKQACRTNSAGISTTGETMSMKLENLTTNKDYHFQSYVIDQHDNIIKGSINSFTTSTEVKCETSGATNITTESVTL
ncbi:MAG: carboxypeptidase regulatory-like domain-containing protein, partial [Bacteroides sp.]|nr:carboxypeptidase regulatory-like domain-containing protein [Bacteroides sp.]